jgi:hypothetical protein
LKNEPELTLPRLTRRPQLPTNKVRDNVDVERRALAKVGFVGGREREFVSAVKSVGEYDGWVGAGAEGRF